MSIASSTTSASSCFNTSADGKTSGLELGKMGAKGAHVFHVRGGKVTRIVNYIDRERAFADLGLPSDAGSAPVTRAAP